MELFSKLSLSSICSNGAGWGHVVDRKAEKVGLKWCLLGSYQIFPRNENKVEELMSKAEVKIRVGCQSFLFFSISLLFYFRKEKSFIYLFAFRFSNWFVFLNYFSFALKRKKKVGNGHHTPPALRPPITHLFYILAFVLSFVCFFFFVFFHISKTLYKFKILVGLVGIVQCFVQILWAKEGLICLAWKSAFEILLFFLGI